MGLIRTDTDYAVRALLYLNDRADPVSCRVVARECRIPRSFAYKILRRLVEVGICQSTPGRSGGFCLSDEADSTTLLTVATAIQGPLTVRQCATEPKACENHPGCALARRWKVLQRQIDRFFSGITLADLAELPKFSASELSPHCGEGI